MDENSYLFSILLVSLVSFIFPAIGLGGGQIYTPAFHWLGIPVKSAVSLAFTGLAYQLKVRFRWHYGFPLYRLP